MPSSVVDQGEWSSSCTSFADIQGTSKVDNPMGAFEECHLVLLARLVLLSHSIRS